MLLGARFARALAVERELRLEQAHQVLRDRRLRDEHALHVRLAERNAGLQQIAAVGAHHHDLARAQARRTSSRRLKPSFSMSPRQAARKASLNSGSSAAMSTRLQIARSSSKSWIQAAPPSGQASSYGLFGDHAQPEILEHRQDVGDRDRVAELAGSAGDSAALLAAGPGAQVELRRRGLGAQRFEVGDVFERLRRARRRRDRPAETRARSAVASSTALAFDAARDQRLLQPVFPGGGGRGDLALRWRRCSRPSRRALRRAHQHVQAREHRIGDLHLRFDVRAAEALAHDALDALAHFGVVAVARHVDEAGIEALVAVAAREQAHAAALVQVDDAAHDAE